MANCKSIHRYEWNGLVMKRFNKEPLKQYSEWECQDCGKRFYA